MSTVGLVSISSFVYVMFQELLMAQCHFLYFLRFITAQLHPKTINNIMYLRNSCHVSSGVYDILLDIFS